MEDQEVRDRDSEAKEKGKLYAEEKHRTRESDVKEGDKVLESLSMTFTADGKRRRFPLIFDCFLVILK